VRLEKEKSHGNILERTAIRRTLCGLVLDEQMDFAEAGRSDMNVWHMRGGTAQRCKGFCQA
jgi:hypothetical protein